MPPVSVITVNITRLSLNQINVLHATVHFVGRSVQEDCFRPRQSRSFQGVECAQRIVLKIAARILHGSGHGDLTGNVDWIAAHD